MITTVARKLQVPAATTVVVLNRPAGIDLDFPADCLVVSDPASAEAADVVIGFAVVAVDLDGIAAPAIVAARDDRLAWLAYPKSRQLGTDLNRDILTALVTARGARPVRSISIDGIWSAIRFRPL
ncbi:MAG TPA: hypothetical protein VGK53_12365 [Propionicimonas sp.]